jgi:hypothetical protein
VNEISGLGAPQAGALFADNKEYFNREDEHEKRANSGFAKKTRVSPRVDAPTRRLRFSLLVQNRTLRIVNEPPVVGGVPSAGCSDRPARDT